MVRSPAWAVARERAGSHRELRAYIGEPLRAARLPRRWRLVGEDGGEFHLEVAGPGGRAQVAVVVSAGRAVEVVVHPLDW